MLIKHNTYLIVDKINNQPSINNDRCYLFILRKDADKP